MEEIAAELLELLPPKSLRQVLPHSFRSSERIGSLLDEALKEPIGSEKFESEVAGKVAIVFSDNTRHHCPFVPDVIKRIEKTDDIKFVSAHGSHNPSHREFFKTVLGDEYWRKYQNALFISSTQDASARYECIGTTTRGTPVEINTQLLDRDLIISTFSVQPHYFAGFEGGAKSLLPGCSSEGSLRMNHSYAIGNPNTKELVLCGNDVREDINEVPALLRKLNVKHRILDFVLDHKGKVVKIGYGDPVLAHTTLAEKYSARMSAVRTKPSNLVVTVADGPMGSNLYQALKAAAFASNGVRKAARRKPVVVLIATMESGIGGEAFRCEMRRYGSMKPSRIIDDLKSRSKEGKTTEASQKLNRLAMDDKKMDLIVVSPSASGEVEELLNSTKYRFFRRLDDALKSLDGSYKRDCIFIPHGSATIPMQFGFP